jgi:drug/metabolite transporter (DMT)-like permease
VSARRDEATAAAVAIGWGTVGPGVRWTGLEPVVVALGRCVVGAVTLWVVRKVRRRPGSATKGVPRAVHARAVASGAVLALHWSAFFVALDRAPVGVVLLIVYLAPVLIALGAPLIGERVAPRTWAALVVAVVGTALVARPSGAATSGVVWALVAAVTYAVVVLVDKTIAAELGGLRLANTKLVVAGVVLVPVVAVTGLDTSGASWGWLLVLGVLHTALGLAVILDVLARIPATVAAVLLYLEPASAVFFGWWWLGEVPTASTLVGGALIVGAGLLVSR